MVVITHVQRNLIVRVMGSCLDVSRNFSYCFLFDSPVMLRKFDSGVMVIQNKSHTDEEVISFISILFHADQIMVWSPFIICLLVGISSLHNYYYFFFYQKQNICINREKRHEKDEKSSPISTNLIKRTK